MNQKDHGHEHKDENSQAGAGTTQAPPPRITDEDLMKTIDEILKQEDKNSDGYITYMEFLNNRKLHG